MLTEKQKSSSSVPSTTLSLISIGILVIGLGLIITAGFIYFKQCGCALGLPKINLPEIKTDLEKEKVAAEEVKEKPAVETTVKKSVPKTVTRELNTAIAKLKGVGKNNFKNAETIALAWSNDAKLHRFYISISRLDYEQPYVTYGFHSPTGDVYSVRGNPDELKGKEGKPTILAKEDLDLASLNVALKDAVLLAVNKHLEQFPETIVTGFYGSTYGIWDRWEIEVKAKESADSKDTESYDYKVFYDGTVKFKP